MASDEMFDSQLRSAGDLAGVFEFDGDAAYFYLYEMAERQGQKILSAIRIVVGTPDFKQEDVAVCWDENEGRVGLLIRDKLWAAFDTITRAGYGGNYHPGRRAEIPAEIAASFESRWKPN
jgi:hypothetical protein